MGVTFVALAMLVVGAFPARAASVEVLIPGFTSQFEGELAGGACSGEGPTSMTVLEGVPYLAADGGLYYKRGGGLTFLDGGNTSPWGVAATRDGKLYATQPACGVEPASPPVPGPECNVVELQPGTARLVRVVSNVCGYGISAHPSNGTLLIGARDGGVISLDPSTGASRRVIDVWGEDPGLTIEWTQDAKRFYARRRSGSVVSFEPPQTHGAVASNTTAMGVMTAELNLSGTVLVGNGQGVITAKEAGPTEPLARASEPIRLIHAGPSGVFVVLPSSLWLLNGKYTPPPPAAAPAPTAAPAPPPTAPAATAPPPRPATPAAPTLAPPPQAPPPPPPPAPPAPPLATASQLVGQPAAMTNAAIVPGDAEREGALRLAATAYRSPSLATWPLWLALVAVVCMAAPVTGRAARRLVPARARATR